ncbi:hypothetical protein PA6559_06864 [Pseudomonas aeruginosa]
MNLAIGVAGHQPGYVMEPACSTGWVGLLDADKALVGANRENGKNRTLRFSGQP